jgi:TrmH family RNA methyltransferase
VEFQDFTPRAPVCLVVGNEIAGVDPAILPLADAAVAIPMQGIKNSLNVEVAFGVVAYHFHCSLMKTVVPL